MTHVLVQLFENQGMVSHGGHQLISLGGSPVQNTIFIHTDLLPLFQQYSHCRMLSFHLSPAGPFVLIFIPEDSRQDFILFLNLANLCWSKRLASTATPTVSH